ncbi:type IV pilus modification protein PilV [Dyella terrae]|uniref:type IV pilus modification protein PilV n=1 Tax=Dyella terrae TaxID=522259 RepID=UPI001EFDEFAC|nr:type IV pilus modification protein PilV [Dyella terrae]ULU27713.1 type IV pilus modification protein PilV [Dyella terrae]
MTTNKRAAWVMGRRQKGVGLIEVLVAVLILSVAFLGIAALQAMSLSANNSSMSKSMATVASYSILDAMRADVDNATKGSYNTSTVLKASACPSDVSTLAASHLAQWCGQLGNTLGVAETTTGAIKCVGNDCTVTISFIDVRPGPGSDSKTKQQTVETRALL